MMSSSQLSEWNGMIGQKAPRHSRRHHDQYPDEPLHQNHVLHLHDRLHLRILLEELGDGNILLGIYQEEVHEGVYRCRHWDAIEEVGVSADRVKLPRGDDQGTVARHVAPRGLPIHRLRRPGAVVQVPEGSREEGVAGAGGAAGHGGHVGNDLEHAIGRLDRFREGRDGLVGEDAARLGEGEGGERVEDGGRIGGGRGCRVRVLVQCVGVLCDVRGIESQRELRRCRRFTDVGDPGYFSNVAISH
mmetsp:Transcript_11296/g.27781  ORF Transcript_11296/g.27781 Transcript_11296/m.27781 type:complete len:245 (+) Transcript_11296:367-1101(+)